MINSEYKRIKSVLVYCPGVEIANLDSLQESLYLRPVDVPGIQKEFNQYINVLENEDIKVYQIDKTINNIEVVYNLMYTRDLLFMTDNGAIMARMAEPIRRKEPEFVENFLMEKKFPIFYKVADNGTFEGADLLWLNEKSVMIAVGNRTNRAGYIQIKDILIDFGIEVYPVDAAQFSLHLLGSVQIVDKDLAFVRVKSISDQTVGLLENYGYSVVKVYEYDEISKNFAMNILTLSPRRIIMPAACPLTKDMFIKNGVDVVSAIDASQLANGGGAFGCATAILERELL